MKKAFLMIATLALFSISSFAKTATVELIDTDGETKTFTFFDSSEKSNAVTTKLPEAVGCSIDFTKDKDFVEVGCVSVGLIKEKKKPKPLMIRTFTRVGCSDSQKSHFIVNTSPLDKDEFKNISLTVSCK